MQSHPEYNPNPAGLAQYRAVLNDPTIAAHYRQHIQRQLKAHLDAMPRPEYTCPTCRKRVKSKPVECFPLKAVVGAMAKAKGQSLDTHRPRRPRQDDPFDGFFPDFSVQTL